MIINISTIKKLKSMELRDILFVVEVHFSLLDEHLVHVYRAVPTVLLGKLKLTLLHIHL
jgi:hypothetical protein